MNDPQPIPSLETPAVAELPSRLLRSPYFVLRTPIGGFYLDAANNERLVKSPVNPLSLFLADAQRVPAPGCDLGEIKYSPRENLRPLRYLHEGALLEFAEAASNFCKGGLNADQASLRQGFRLPDPGKDPDAYWVWGDRFAPRLLILWGCEKEQGSSLPLVGDGRNVIKELRAKAMSWTRLFREGVELSRLKDPLAVYIAFPVLSPDGKLTHLDRLENGQYIREEVHTGRGKSWKARPLQRLPGRAILQFQKAAEEFYRKAHRNDCGCSRCVPGGTAQPSSTGKSPAPVLSYEQEVRRGFRLPDPELRPDAYFVTGHTLGQQLLILCPNPGIKDAEEIAQMEKDVKWTEDKARNPEEKERAAQFRQQYEQDLATHNLYKRYFYADHECLPLTSDPVLGLPVPAAKPSPGTAPLPVPVAASPKTAAKPAEQTVVGKLKSIDWGKLIKIWGSVLFLLIAAGVTYHIIVPKRLELVSVAMSNDPALDPGNQRNVIEVIFNNLLAENRASHTNLGGSLPALLGQYSLRCNGNEYNPSAPQLNPTNHRCLTLVMTNLTLEDGSNYTLYLAKAKDVWGNIMAQTNCKFEVVDTRSPSVRGDVRPGSSEVEDSLLITFDEPLDKANAEKEANYSVEGRSITSAKLQPDRQTVVIKADKPFESGAPYQLKLAAGITDAAARKNPLRQTNVSFTYAQIPLRLESVSARDSQIRIKLVFNKAYDLNSAKTALKLDNLKVGTVQVLDSKALEIVLTNSYMTNGAYALHIAGLQDTGGKAGSGLSTNLSFAYEGSIDATPPVLIPGGLAASSTRLELTFSKDLREDAASKEANYVLSAQNGGAWSPVATLFQAGLRTGDNRVVALSLASSLPRGRLRLQYSNLEDLFGNKTSGEREFSVGLSPRITIPKAAQIISGGVRFTLSGHIDEICTNAANFEVEDLQGNPLSVDVLSVVLVPAANTTEVNLSLSKSPNRESFQIRCSKLRLKDDAWEQPPVLVTTPRG